MKDTIIGTGVAVILVLGGFVLGFVVTTKNASQQDASQAGPQAGAISGPEFFVPAYAHQTITVGGGVLASTSQGAATYTASQLINNQLIQQTASAALTETLPASSTLTGFIPKAGDSRTVYIAAITNNVTLSAGTGMTLTTASSTKTVNAGGLGELRFVRKVNSDILVILNTGI